MQGTVQVFNSFKGFGFILVDFRTRMFFHVKNYTGAIEPVGGMVVTFDVAPPHKAGQLEQAVNVVPVTPVSVETEVGGAL
jgi:cold shock CspA family protein